MAYSTSNPPIRTSGGLGGAQQVWQYVSTDVHTDVDATDYFSNGDELGMKVNDLVSVTKSTATIGVTWHVVTAVTAGGAATVSAAILS